MGPEYAWLRALADEHDLEMLNGWIEEEQHAERFDQRYEKHFAEVTPTVECFDRYRQPVAAQHPGQAHGAEEGATPSRGSPGPPEP